MVRTIIKPPINECEICDFGYLSYLEAIRCEAKGKPEVIKGLPRMFSEYEIGTSEPIVSPQRLFTYIALDFSRFRRGGHIALYNVWEMSGRDNEGKKEPFFNSQKKERAILTEEERNYILVNRSFPDSKNQALELEPSQIEKLCSWNTEIAKLWEEAKKIN